MDDQETVTYQRIFVGVPVDKQMQHEIKWLLEILRLRGGNLRWVAAENRHLTLAFLGEIRGDDVARLIEAFDEAYLTYPAFPFRFSALERFPDNRGRIVALTGETSPPLDHLAMATRDMLQRCGLRFERKRFRPHVTLARIRNLRRQVAGLGQRTQIDMDINRVLLYSSTLTNTGSIYSVLGEVVLP